MAILLKGWILPIGVASLGEGLSLQPVQQACLIITTEGVDMAQFEDWPYPQGVLVWFMLNTLYYTSQLWSEPIPAGKIMHKV